MWNEIIQYALMLALLGIILLANKEHYDRHTDNRLQLRYQASRIDRIANYIDPQDKVEL